MAQPPSVTNTEVVLMYNAPYVDAGSFIILGGTPSSVLGDGISCNTSKILESVNQQELFNIPIKGFKALAPLVGSVGTSLVANVIGGKMLRTTVAFRVCPDIITPENDIVEVKVCENSNRFNLYEAQLDRYKGLVRSGVSVFYAFVIYNARSCGDRVFKQMKPPVVSTFLSMFSKSVACMVLVDLRILLQWIDHVDPKRNVWKGQHNAVSISVTPRVVRGWANNPIGSLDDMGVHLGNTTITLLGVTGAQIDDVKVQSFPLTIYRYTDGVVSHTQVSDIGWVLDRVCATFNSVDDPVPF